MPPEIIVAGKLHVSLEFVVAIWGVVLCRERLFSFSLEML